MTTQVNIPKLGIAMTEGTLVEWTVEDGETVEAGQVIYVLETDKVDNEIEATASGVIRQIGEPGEVYEVGENIGRIE